MSTSQSLDPRAAQRKARLVALLAELADVLLDGESGPEAPRYFSADDPGPLRTARAFLDAGRRRDFPTMKIGKRVVAKASDVYAWIEASGAQPKPKREKAIDRLSRFPRKVA